MTGDFSTYEDLNLLIKDTVGYQTRGSYTFKKFISQQNPGAPKDNVPGQKCLTLKMVIEIWEQEVASQRGL